MVIGFGQTGQVAIMRGVLFRAVSYIHSAIIVETKGKRKGIQVKGQPRVIGKYWLSRLCVITSGSSTTASVIGQHAGRRRAELAGAELGYL